MNLFNKSLFETTTHVRFYIYNKPDHKILKKFLTNLLLDRRAKTSFFKQHLERGFSFVFQSPLTLAVGALARAFCNNLRARSNSLFSDSSFTAASQISSLLGLAWKARASILLAAGTSPCKNHQHNISPKSSHCQHFKKKRKKKELSNGHV